MEKEKTIPCLRCGAEISALHQSCPRCGFMPFSAVFQGADTSSAPHQRQQATHIVPPQSAPFSSGPGEVEPIESRGTLAPETALQRNQYLLLEQQEIRQWGPHVHEALWLAQEMKRAEEVIIHEVVVPLSGSSLHQFLRAATNAVMTSSYLAQMPQLLDVFMEHRRCFFVFEQFVGESLHARVQRAESLNEQDAIACYRQLAEALLVLSRHHPPIVHGWIEPRHIVNMRSRWVLTNASVLAAGGAAHLLAPATTEGGSLNMACSPQADLSALANTMYVAVMGAVAPSDGWVQQAHLAQARLAPAFRAVLLRGIQPSLQGQYHHPSEIIHALRADTDAEQGASRRERRSQVLADIEAKQHQQPASTSAHQPEPASILPQPPVTGERHTSEENEASLPAPLGGLPPFPRGRDALWAAVWTTGILMGGILLLLVAR